MIRKLLLSGMAMMVSLIAMADYNYMEFKYSNGDSALLDAAGLTILVNEQGNLEVYNSLNQTLDINAWDIVAMKFTNGSTTGIEGLNSGYAAITVYSLDGMVLGQYEDLDSAVASLSKGVYVIRNEKGESKKLIIGKWKKHTTAHCSWD